MMTTLKKENTPFATDSGMGDQTNQKQPLTDLQADKLSNKSEDSGIGDTTDEIERNRQMLESQMSCDVMFFVGEKREKLGAHKEKLMARSGVFKLMFTGPGASKSEFEIPDISCDVFWELLRHIYCNEEKLKELNVVEILYAAELYDILPLSTACRKYLKTCIGISTACYLLVEVHKYGFVQEEKKILSFIRRNAEDVFDTVGMDLLSRELLNQLMTLPDLDLEESVKKKTVDKWAKNHCELNRQNPNLENIMDSLQDCLYVYRDDSHSHRYVMDSVTSRNIFDEREEVPAPPLPEGPTGKGLDSIDGMSTISSVRSRSSVHTYSRLPSCNMWPDLDQVTRLQEVHGSDINNAKKADAICFSVDKNIYLFGFSIYGPKKEGEGKYQVDTVVSRKKRDIIMESIHIKGAGIILPVMFERPIKIDANIPYTLEIYVTGPNSHMGASGQGKIQYRDMLFTFNDSPKIKCNRSSKDKGQIPRLYFMPRNK